jgi:hypothetical protein
MSQNSRFWWVNAFYFSELTHDADFLAFMQIVSLPPSSSAKVSIRPSLCSA